MIIVGLSAGTIGIGQFSLFTCDAEVPVGTTENVLVQIRRPGGEILIEDNSVQPNGFFSASFFIVSPQASDSGQYLCTVFLNGDVFNTETFGVDFEGTYYYRT